MGRSSRICKVREFDRVKRLVGARGATTKRSTRSGALDNPLESDYYGILRNLEDSPVNRGYSNIWMVPDIPGAENWMMDGIGSEQHGLYDWGRSSTSDGKGCNDSSPFGGSIGKLGDMSFTSAQTMETTDNSIADTASNSSFAYSPLRAVNNPVALTPAKSNGDVPLLTHCHNAALVANTIARQPAILPQRKPKQPRSTCDVCKKTFGRPPDMVRHQRDIHETGSFIYKCQVCKHGKFGRRDKMVAHCKLQDHGEVLVVEVASNPEVAFAIHASRRRQNVKSPVGDT